MNDIRTRALIRLSAHERLTEMALKALDCPNCGGLIETFDETTKKGFCPYCDSLLVNVADLQNAYEMENRGRADRMLERIDGFVVIGRADKALVALREFTDEYPADFRGWHKLCELDAQSELDAPFEQNLAESVGVMVSLAKTGKEKEGVRKVRDAFSKKRDDLSESLRIMGTKKAEIMEAGNSLEKERQSVEASMEAARATAESLWEKSEAAKKAHLDESKEVDFGLKEWVGTGAVIGAAVGVVRILANLGEIAEFYGLLESVLLIPVTLVIYALLDGAVGAVACLILGTVIGVIRCAFRGKKVAKLSAHMKEELDRYQEGKRIHEEKLEELARVNEKISSNKNSLADAERREEAAKSKISTIEKIIHLSEK